MAIVYLVTNTINSKKYVGATITKLNERWNRHTSDSWTEKDGQALHAAIRKYGKEKFTIEQICEDTDEIFIFQFAEKFFIEYYKSHGSFGGYNMTWGGDGWLGMSHSDETKKLIGDKNRGKVRTPEMLERMSVAQKGKTPWNKGIEAPQCANGKRGVSLSETHRKNAAAGNIGKKRTDEHKNRMKLQNAMSFTLRLPDGTETTGKNLREFCQTHDISQGNLLSQGHTKGYKLLKTTKIQRTYTIQNTDNNECFEVDNVRQFCKDRGISDAGLLGKYTKGRAYLNWKIIGEKESEIVALY